MTGTIELDSDGRHLNIAFPYREDLVEEVRTLPKRRWDKARKVWRVPATEAELVVDTFMKHGFEIASEVMAVLAGTQAVPPPEKKKDKAEKTADDDDDSKPLTVSRLNERVKDALAAAFPQRVQVVGEVVDFDKNADKKHIFFQLIEKAPVGDRILAKAEFAMFERTAQRLIPKLETEGLSLRDGVEIMVEGRVDFWTGGGLFRLVVDKIHSEFTLGKMSMSRDQVLKALREAELHERNLELQLPIPPTRIGVLTSAESDGWADFERELESSGLAFDVTLYPVRVQGQELRPTVLAGLRWFEEHADDFDCICIVRGGGSKTDLAGFDDKDVAFAVAKHPLKVLVGIGHERDRSVLDEIAHSLKTPTATAGFLVQTIRQMQAELSEQNERVRTASLHRLELADRELTQAGERLARGVQTRLDGERRTLGIAAKRTVRGASSFLRQRQRDVVAAAQRIVSGTRGSLRHAALGLERDADRVARSAESSLERAAARITTSETRLRLLDPKRVLARGYALVRDPSTGRVVTSAAALSEGTTSELQLRDGRAQVRVESVSEEPPTESPDGSTQED